MIIPCAAWCGVTQGHPSVLLARFLKWDTISEMSEANEEYLRILRAMMPEQKLLAVPDLYHTARVLKADGLRMQHPDWGEEQIERALRDIFLYGQT